MKTIAQLQKYNILFGTCGLLALLIFDRSEGAQRSVFAFACGLMFALFLVEFYKFFLLAVLGTASRGMALLFLLCKFPLIAALVWLAAHEGKAFIMHALTGLAVLIPASLLLAFRHSKDSNSVS